MASVDFDACKDFDISDSIANNDYTSNKEYYPLVGVSYEQARSYTKWRTNTVARVLLIEKGYIRFNRQQSKDSYFTIESYLDGTYPDIIVHDTSIVFPEYRIPTAEEWIMFSGVESLETNRYSPDNKNNRIRIEEYGMAYNTLDRYEYNKRLSNGYQHFIEPSYSKKNGSSNNGKSIGDENVFGLYNIVGNVSEIVANGEVMGGNWMEKINKEVLTESRKIDVPNCRTGFRNICYYNPR